MKFASVRVVTSDVETLRDFYALLTGVPAIDLAPGFAEIRLQGCTLAISSEDLINKLNGGAIVPGSNRSSMIELEVNDVETLKTRIVATNLAEIVQQPTLMPWGNQSMLVRDPDGAFAKIAAPISSVPTVLRLSCAMSPVRRPSLSTAEMAFSIFVASSIMPNE
jgi:uncharacterized glyoxalase superfamily protein PhnB